MAGQTNLKTVVKAERSEQPVARPAARSPVQAPARADPYSTIGPATGTTRAITWVFTLATAGGLAYAWTQRLEGHVVPYTGIGYGLGITGCLIMLALLLYPVRKYWRPMQRLGTVRAWFTTHMLLGILGPALVVVHSNFQLKSTNAAVAMGVMLTVVLSGLFGRYIYFKLNIGAGGQQAGVAELLRDAEAMHHVFGDDMQHAPDIEAELKAYEAESRRYRFSRLGSFRALLFFGGTTRRVRRRVLQDARQIISARALREHWDVETHAEKVAAALDHLEQYFATVKRATTLNFFVRLFRLWHILHTPLFFLLVIVAIGHVLAVHMY
jgi:hypothetical protein